MKQKINFNQGLTTIWLIAITALVTALVVGGLVFIWQKSAANKKADELQQQISDLQNQIQQLQQANQKTDETANWQTYTNKQYGLEIKYPSGWTLQDTMANHPNEFLLVSKAFFSGSNLPAHWYSTKYAIIEFQMKGDIEEDLQAYFNNISKPCTECAPTPPSFVAYTTIAGDKAIKAKQNLPGTDGYFYVYYIKDKILYKFTLKLPDANDETIDNVYIDTFDQILSTFKFID